MSRFRGPGGVTRYNILDLYSGKDKSVVWAGLAEPLTCFCDAVWRLNEVGRGLERNRCNGCWLPFYSLSLRDVFYCREQKMIVL